MDEQLIRKSIYEIAKELGLKIRSIQHHPITKAWHIDIIGRDKPIRITTLSGVTQKECYEQLKRILDIAGHPSLNVEEEIANLRGRDRDNIFAAMQRLQKIGSPAIEPLIQVLLNPTEPFHIRVRATDTLEMIGDPETSQQLVQRLNDPDVQARWLCLQALARLGDERAIPPLEQIAATGIEPAQAPLFGYNSAQEEALIAIARIKERARGIPHEME